MRLASYWSRAIATALLAALLAALYYLDRHGYVPAMVGSAQVTVYATVVAAALAAAFAPAPWRKPIFVAAAAVAAQAELGWWLIALAGYITLVIVVARMQVRVLVRCGVVLVVWLALPIARFTWMDADQQLDTLLLAILWAGELYSAFYLIVEREREAPEQRPTILSDVFYLAALPRFVVPFFQPISPNLIATRERDNPRPRRLLAAAGLAAWGTLSAIVAWRLLHYVHHTRVHWIRELPHHWITREVLIFLEAYARLTYTIFLAVAVFRLIGFDLPSGYRRPFLSRSYGEFFRRFNHYVRDAVLSLFYYPVLGHLRLRMRPRLATIASAYVAILFGSLMLHDLLVPFATTIDPASTGAYYLDPVRIGSMLALWTLIVVPTAGIAPRRRPPMTRTRAVLHVIAFNVTYFVLWYAQRVGRGFG